ncbi:MAG: hypothetical protein H0V51_09200 [Chloroflexi bacterium]|nr:hypothetical protein [Chloroflexota bacterium]
MYTLTRSVAPRDLLVQQATTLVPSIVIAELFYKFHSFTLECVAFLATWFVLDFVRAHVTSALTRPSVDA